MRYLYHRLRKKCSLNVLPSGVQTAKAHWHKVKCLCCMQVVCVPAMQLKLFMLTIQTIYLFHKVKAHPGVFSGAY